MRIKPRHLLLAVLWPFMMTSLALLFVLPGFIHCFDTGQERLDVGQIDRSAGSNLLLRAKVLTEKAICLEETSLRYQYSNYTYFVPLASTDVSDRQIKCILKLSGKDLDDLQNRQNKGERFEIEAVRRDLLWEGLDNDVLQAFIEKENVPEEIAYAEMGKQSSFPLWLGGIVFSVALLGSVQIIKVYGKKPIGQINKKTGNEKTSS